MKSESFMSWSFDRGEIACERRVIIPQDRMMERVVTYLQNKNLVEEESYLKRGRSFKNAETSALKELWTHHFRTWANDVQDLTARTMSEDIQVELSLRGDGPPYETVEEEMDKIKDLATNTLIALTDERKSEIDEELLKDIEEFEAEWKGPN